MEEIQSTQKRELYAEVFVLGFLLLSAQIILIREFLIIFNGNELVVGILFSIWMLCTALGAWSGRFFDQLRSYIWLIRFLLIIIAVYPVFAAFSLEYFRNSFFEQGRMISFYEVIFFSTAVLLPLCFAGGLAFNLINISVERKAGNMQDCYSYESAGSLVGSILISTVFIYYLKLDNFLTLQYLALIAFIYFGIAEFRLKRHFISLLYLLFALGIMHLNYSYDISFTAKAKLYQGQQIVEVADSPYGNVTVTKGDGQTNVYLDGQILYSSDDVIQKEEDVHYAMLQRQEASAILLIGGGISGTLNEVMKYAHVSQIDYVEQNEVLIDIARELGSIDDSHLLRIIRTDPVDYLKRSKEKYDVVLINQAPPNSAQTNRFYTKEFYISLKAILKDGGIISVSLPASENYLSDDELMLQSSIYNSLSDAYRNVIIVPGSKIYFLSSDENLSLNYNAMISDAGIDNSFVNDSFIDDKLLKFESELIKKSLIPGTEPNLNFKPIVYTTYISHWLSYFGIAFWIIPAICLSILMAFLFFSQIHTTAIFSSGFSGAATELILIIAFQVIFGYVYIFIGNIITTFMAGLALGSRLSRACSMKKPMRLMYFTQLFSAIYMVSIILSLYYIESIGSLILVKVIFIVMMFAVAALTGFQYGISVCYKRMNAGATVSAVYASDLSGSATGSLLAVALLIPKLGIYYSLLLLVALHFITLLIMVLKRK